MRLIFTHYSRGNTIQCNTSCQVFISDPSAHNSSDFFVRRLFLEDNENTLKKGFDENRLIREVYSYGHSILFICIPILINECILFLKKPMRYDLP
jgi:hypothetical protein